AIASAVVAVACGALTILCAILPIGSARVAIIGGRVPLGSALLSLRIALQTMPIGIAIFLRGFEAHCLYIMAVTRAPWHGQLPSTRCRLARARTALHGARALAHANEMAEEAWEMRWFARGVLSKRSSPPSRRLDTMRLFLPCFLLGLAIGCGGEPSPGLLSP